MKFLLQLLELRFLEKADWAILDGFYQKVADWWSTHTQWSHFLLAQILAWATLVSYTAQVVFFYTNPGELVLKGFVVLNMMWVIQTCQRLRAKESMLRRYSSNPFRYNLTTVIMRRWLGLLTAYVFTLIVPIVSVGGWMHLWRLFLEPLCYMSAFYLASCRPPFPDRSYKRIPAFAKSRA